jgi:cytochrome P450
MRPGIQAGHEDPPGPSGLPVIGNLRDIARERPWFLERTAAKYGDVVRYRFGPGREMYGLFHPDHVGRVLVDERENYCKGDFFNSRMAFLGDSVLTSEGEAWRDQRAVIEPIFHPDRIEAYVADMATYSERLADSWSDGEVRDVYDDYIGLALEIVAGALFDFDIRRAQDDIGGSLDQVMAHFRRKSRRPVDVPDWLPTLENLRYRRAVRTLDGAVSDIVRQLSGEGPGRGPQTDGEHAQSLERHGTGGAFARLVDGFDAACEPDNEELHSQVTTLLVAGHETTAQAMSYACYLLAHHPKVEDRLVAEIRSVLDGDEVTAAEVPRLEYTRQVIREAMRLYPPVPSFPRETVDADVVDGYHIPAGNTVWVSPWVVQRDERFWNAPEQFDPDRWDDRGRDDRHPFAYFPFGGGPRRCLGDRFAMTEASVVLATLLRDYSLEPVPGRDLDLAPAITLRPAGGLALEVRER